jgi:hypothetical protein
MTASWADRDQSLLYKFGAYFFAFIQGCLNLSLFSPTTYIEAELLNIITES